MFKFIYRLKYFHKTDETVSKTKDLLESGIKRICSIDPQTDTQWMHLKNALETKQNVGRNRFSIPRYNLKPAFSFAAVAIMLIAAGVIWLRYSSIRIYETAKGQHSSITLQDSTEVMLNYMSELKVNRSPFEKVRHVTLKGEALFRVQRNGTPFIITTDVGTVQVLGTQFNVRVRDEKMEVAVLDGSVKVNINKNGRDSSVILGKGQVVVCDKNNFPEVPKTLPFTGYPGWIQGKFMFYRTSFLSACKELELQFDVIVKIENPQQHNVTITGIVDGQSVESALTTLTQLTGNNFRYENGNYIIY